jgi:hypothetical protein
MSNAVAAYMYQHIFATLATPTGQLRIRTILQRRDVSIRCASTRQLRISQKIGRRNLAIWDTRSYCVVARLAACVGRLGQPAAWDVCSHTTHHAHRVRSCMTSFAVSHRYSNGS